MKYQCGHEGCDICGARQCGSHPANFPLERQGKYIVCLNCKILAIKVAIEMAETFGETIIDLSKPCGVLKN
jgi:rRNA maturation protein Nop10